MDRRTLLQASALVPAAGLATLPSVPRIPDPGPDGIYNLCFLGDSYMAGNDSSDNNGCRYTVTEGLYRNNETHNIRCVGSQSSTGTTQWGSIPLVHEGHGGWTTTQLLGLVQNGTLNYPQGIPHAVFLMAGANDFGQGLNATQVRDNLNALVDAVLGLSANLVMVLCENILMSSYNNSTLTNRTRQEQELNALLPALVDSKLGRVALAKTSLLDQGDINSYGVHPTDTGYQKMAYILYNALAAWFGYLGKYMVPIKCPWPTDPLAVLNRG